MQKGIKLIVKLLLAISPRLAARFAYFLFFKPFKLKSHPLDLEKKKNGNRLDFVVNGKKTSTWYWGEGPVVILVHGWSSKGFHYRKFIDKLVAKGFTVVIPDMPGHVNSDGKTANVLEFKETLERIFEHFGKVHGLVGHSLGALACILLLSENRYKANKLVVANSAAYAQSTMNRFMEIIGGNKKLEEALLERIRKVFKKDFNDYSAINLIQQIEDLPESLVIGDSTDPEVPIAEIREFAQTIGARMLETIGYGHNNGLKSEDVVIEVVQFLA